MHELKLKTRKKEELVDVTPRVAQILESSKIRDGMCMVFVPHTTAGVIIGEGADPAVAKDIIGALEKMVPEEGKYTHSEGNSPAHVKASIVGSSVSVFVEDGKLALGRWQSIFFSEFDGPRDRQVWIKIIGSKA